MEYKKQLETCSGCQYKNTLEHQLFHDTGLSERIIRELKLESVEDIETAFKNATIISKCFISLNGRRTKIREENKFIYPKKLIDLISKV